MASRYAKVSEIADRFRVSADAVYLWIRQGKIPADCVARIAGTVRVDEEQFEQRLRSGALCQPRGRKRPALREQETGRPLVSMIAEDSLTTVRTGLGSEHRWVSESGKVRPEHPYSPGMITTSK
jgi:transposase